MTIAVGVIVMFYVNGRVRSLETKIDEINVAPIVIDSQTTTTLAPPIDLPPPDGHVARREIVTAFTELFAESTPEKRQQLLTTPSELPDRIQGLAGGPCAGTLPVITELRFLDDDRAVVRFRFDGPTLPQIARSTSFDGLAVRVDGRWRIDPAAPLAAIDLGSTASVCGRS
ncbi:MAG TPA: hypothetical protein VL068_08895 [Microthrixaceae bacterium]|nr:hypothetical protein [Microthrixaceae bacterium]